MNICVIDTAEGQHPSDFEQTFLALHAGVKLRIQFVQGKYHMGSSGVLRFRGNDGYKFILSRRHPKLLRGDQQDLWGFTLIRWHRAGPGDRSSWFEYCTREDGWIFSFSGEDLPLLPEDRMLSHGTFIKLFNYELRDTSVITLGLWRELNRRLYYPALPIILYDKRQYGGHSPSKILLGNKYRIKVDDRSLLKDETDIEADLKVLGHRHIVEYSFSPEARKNEFFSDDEAIFFTINGQTHATIGRSFLKSKAEKPYIADKLLVHIDCSDVDVNILERVFMASRDRMAKGVDTKGIEDALAEELRESSTLKAWKEEYRRNIISSVARDQQKLDQVILDSVVSDPYFGRFILRSGSSRPIAAVDPGPVKSIQWRGREIPTYLRIHKWNEGKGLYQKALPINSYVRVLLETDASDDYFRRPPGRGGTLIVHPPEMLKSREIRQGIIWLTLKPAKDAREGSTTLVTVKLTRPELDPLTVQLQVRYIPPHPTKQNPGKKNPQLPGSASYPRPIPVDRSQWQEIGEKLGYNRSWTGDDIADVRRSSDSMDVYINMNATIFENALQQLKLFEKARQFFIERYCSSIYYCAVAVHKALSDAQHSNDFDSLEDLLPSIMKNLVHYVLYILRNNHPRDLDKGEEAE
ncbi:MAG: hypothetical protein RMK40_08410 [Chloroflexota bacterium]|nr:hypothetical protein [Chloroflexota bacterium]